MAFFTSAISTLQTLVTALGAGLGVWGVINLLEGYGNDNPGAMVRCGKITHENFVELTAAPLFRSQGHIEKFTAICYNIFLQ